MQQKACKPFTYRTRINTCKELDDDLTKCSYLLSKVERSLFKDYYQKNKNINELKSFYIKRFGITARQFNSCRIKLKGKVSSFKTLLKERTSNLETRIRKLKKHIKNLKDPFKKHHKKRLLCKLEKKLENLKIDIKENRVRICFGSKKLFRKQFSLEENAYTSHDEWKKTWQDKRNDSFFLVGSKDETNGNQSCQITCSGDNFNLIVRLPNSFSRKSIVLEDICFAYGQEEIFRAIDENEKRKDLKKEKRPYSHLGKALSYLFKKDKKGWTVFVTVDKDKPNKTSNSNIGMIGLDINVNHIALAETDHFGNIIYKKNIPLNLYGKDKNQTLAIIGDATREIVEIAIAKEKPIVLEDLNFEKKKQALKEQKNKYSRMLSSFAYSKIVTFIESRSFKKGIQIYKVNPAFTSIIGRVNFKDRYGLSSHQAAALTIARRVCRYSEKPPRYLEIENKDSKSAFFLHDVNRKKHVWSFYSWLNKKLKAANVLQLSTIFRSSRPMEPLCDSKASIIYRGSFGTLIVNKTARLT